MESTFISFQNLFCVVEGQFLPLKSADDPHPPVPFVLFSEANGLQQKFSFLLLLRIVWDLICLSNCQAQPKLQVKISLKAELALLPQPNQQSKTKQNKTTLVGVVLLSVKKPPHHHHHSLDWKIGLRD